MILLTGCSYHGCPCFPSPNDRVKDILRPYQNKDKYPETWEWFNQLLKLKEQLPKCEKSL